MGSVEIITIIGVVGTICSIVFGYIGYNKGLKKESRTEGEDHGTLKSDLQYMKRLLEDVLLEQKDTNKSINVLSERVARVEESSKQAHKRIDELKKEIGETE